MICLDCKLPSENCKCCKVCGEYEHCECLSMVVEHCPIQGCQYAISGKAIPPGFLQAQECPVHGDISRYFGKMFATYPYNTKPFERCEECHQYYQVDYAANIQALKKCETCRVPKCLYCLSPRPQGYAAPCLGCDTKFNAIISGLVGYNHRHNITHHVDRPLDCETLECTMCQMCEKCVGNMKRPRSGYVCTDRWCIIGKFTGRNFSQQEFM